MIRNFKLPSSCTACFSDYKLAYHCPRLIQWMEKCWLGAPLSLYFFFSCEVCICGGYLTDAVQDQPLTLSPVSPGHGGLLEAEPESRRSEGIIRESVCDYVCVCVCVLLCVDVPFFFFFCNAFAHTVSEHFFHICMCETLRSP